MTLVWTAAVLIFFVVVRAQQQHSCYVCVSEGSSQEVTQLFPHDSLVPCRVSSQVKKCPQGYMGCLTESKGSEVTRTCTQLAVDGCRSANGVEYCYCRGELCNVPTLQASGVDDEDMTEGSGVTEVTVTTIRVPTVDFHHNNTKVSSSSRPLPSSILFLLLVTVWR